MVDFAAVAEREDGKTPIAAIREACLVRFRPIMMTTMCALVGTLPIAFENARLRLMRRRAAEEPADAVPSTSQPLPPLAEAPRAMPRSFEERIELPLLESCRRPRTCPPSAIDAHRVLREFADDKMAHKRIPGFARF